MSNTNEGCLVILILIGLAASVVVFFGWLTSVLYNFIVVNGLALSSTEMSVQVGIAVWILCSLLFKSSTSSSK